MLIGGTVFSTAGGIKIARIILIFHKLINYKENTTTFHDKNHNLIIIITIIIIVNLLLFRQLRFNFEKESSHFTNQIINLKNYKKIMINYQ